MTRKDEEWAIFWCSLLSPLLFGEVPEAEVGRFLHGLSEKEVALPGGKRGKPSLSTLRRKWKQYKKGGFQGLYRRRRNDRGKPRKVPTEMIEKAVELKKEQPYRSDKAINQFLGTEFQRTIPKSTLYRYLKQAGATRMKLGVTRRKVRCRWTRDTTHSLWVGDFEHGPFVAQDDGQVVQTHLSAFIDCHSRYVVEARYYLRENLDILIDSLLRAWATHGASRQLYLDNGKVYHAHALKAVCFALNIQLLHRPVRDPAPGGLIERWFETTQGQFEAEVRAGDILTLEKLNRALAAWLQVSYHQSIHTETGQTPDERYQQGLQVTRQVDLQEAVQFFLKRVERTVHADFSDVQLDGLFFRVDPKLRGDKVEVRYDPFAPLDRVLIYSLDGEYLGVGTRHQRQKGGTSAMPASSPGKPRHNYIDLLIDRHEETLAGQSRGIDYQAVLSKQGWPFQQFVKKFALLLGRKGGLSAFRTDELETMKKVYQKHAKRLDQSLLQKAFEQADEKTVLVILFHLQHLAYERRP